MPPRFSKLDALALNDHAYLTADDEIYYLHEYTSHRGYAFGRTNDLISNLKKPMDRRGRQEWRYKESAIGQCAQELRRATGGGEGFTWVPVPPSKAKSDPLYDDRLVRILRGAFPHGDIRELVLQTQSLEASHLNSASRPPPRVLEDNYAIDTSLGQPATQVVVFDDVLTSGSHFRAVERTLRDVFPTVRVIGAFIARRVFPDDDEQ